MVGQYRIIRLLGRGGMGEVYEVEHTTLGRRYALKLLPADFSSRPQALERFRREARVMANLDHPNIVRVDEFGETDGRYWLRMELAAGDSLQGYADSLGGRIPQEALLEILQQVLAGLSYAHEQGAIHRDLKPSNILLSQPGPSARVSDFGLVRLVGEDWVQSQAKLSVERSMSLGGKQTVPGEEGSSTRSLLGTYEYMSPEQKRGQEADERSDVYALGLMTYKLLTGRGLGMKRPSEIDDELVEAWDRLTSAALEEEPEERLSGCGQFSERLQDVGRQVGELRREEQERREREEADARARREREAAERRAEEALRRRQEERARKEEREKAAAEARQLEERRTATKQRRSETTRQSRRKTALFLVPMLAAVAIGVGIWLRSRPTASPTASLGRRAARNPLSPSKPWTSPSTGMEFVWIEKLGMWVGKYEVTNGEYRKKSPDHDSMEYQGHSLNGDRQPVVYVNFDDAKAYAQWLTEQDRRSGRLPAGFRYRLPSEQEWVTFAQCGDGREYPWGDNWPPRSGQAGNYSDSAGAFDYKIDGYNDGHPVTCDVAKSWANPWGLYGVGGNVWEACVADSSGGSFGAWRGAAWGSGGQGDLRCSYRINAGPSFRDDADGFRLVLSR